MALAAFDTLEFVDELEKAGVPAGQARAISSAVRKSHESLNVATKQDIAELRQQDIAELRHEMEGLRKDLVAVEERTDAKLEKLGSDLRHEMRELATGLRSDMEKLGTELRYEISDLRKDTEAQHESLRKDMDAKHESLRKDMDAKFAGMDTKHESLRKGMDAKFAGMDAKHDLLRKDMFHEMKELESRLLAKLGGIVVGSLTSLSIIFGLIAKFTH